MRRTGMVDGVGSWSYDYDPMGRVSETTWSNAALPGGQQTGNFAYNLAGGMKSSAWPGIFDGSTALTVHWSYDASGKQTAAWWSNAGQSVHQQQLVDGHRFDYTGSSAATWAVETTDLPNGTVETVTYNDRMQPRQRRLTNPSVVWNLDYDFTDGAGKNNGNVWGIDETTSGWSSNRDQTFTYDPPPPRLRRAGLAQPDQDGPGGQMPSSKQPNSKRALGIGFLAIGFGTISER